MYTLPFYTETESLRSLVRKWAQAPWYSLDVTLHQSAFWLAVYGQSPPVIIVGASEQQLKQQFIARLRAAACASQSAIVVVIESDAESLVVESLQQGADRVVAIPRCNASIFSALIKSLLPRSPATTISYAPYLLNTRTQTVSFDNNHIRLRRRQFEVAHYLFLHNSKMIPRDMLLLEVWGLGNELYTTRRVEQQISLAKRQLVLDGTHGWKLRSGRGRNRGYGLFRVANSEDEDKYAIE